MRVLVQLRHSPSLEAAVAAERPTGTLAFGTEGLAPGFTLDAKYEPVLLPLVRGEVADSGINRAHLVRRGQDPKIDVRRSWTPPSARHIPGRHAVDHGTMCAFDVGITAPRSPLLEYAL